VAGRNPPAPNSRNPKTQNPNPPPHHSQMFFLQGRSIAAPSPMSL
jgi:hypothetical protein